MGRDVRELVSQASRALAAAGLGDMVWGHASVRDPGGRGVWMKASGWGFEEIDVQRVVLVSAGGAVLDGTGRRHLEYRSTPRSWRGARMCMPSCTPTRRRSPRSRRWIAN
jgi:ribulose-5-phosphate 4-epimerase/fuculose-1-phosphate aldolase